jgi:ABC-type amino acid transport system permease subunit
VLEDIGEFYEAEASRRIKRLIIAFEPVIILVMGTYLAISLITSLLMNLYNRRVQVLER